MNLTGITNSVATYDLLQTNKNNKTETQKDLQTQAVKSGEEKLSAKAKEYLKTLRETYGDYEFFVANGKDEVQSALKESEKEVSVVFSTAELEKMATDEKYAKEKLDNVKTILEMSNRINDQFNMDGEWNKTNSVNKIIFDFTEGGDKPKIFAELEKTTEKQMEIGGAFCLAGRVSADGDLFRRRRLRFCL